MTTTQQARDCILGDVDLDLFLEHVDPDWKERWQRVEDGNVYYASEEAWEWYTKDSTINEIKALIAESVA